MAKPTLLIHINCVVQPQIDFNNIMKTLKVKVYRQSVSESIAKLCAVMFPVIAAVAEYRAPTRYILVMHFWFTRVILKVTIACKIKVKIMKPRKGKVYRQSRKR